MKHRVYLMEQGFLDQLLADRRELFEVARSLGTADEMRIAREDVLASISAINVTPKSGESAAYTVADGVATIPIVGELTPKAQTDICGAYTADALTEYGYIVEASRQADADPTVETIAYQIDSPGGYADGVTDAANAMREVSKPTVAYVGGMAASAAYWLASQADRIVATSRASRFGSIGVAVEQYDVTEAMKAAGITKRVFTSTDAPDKRPDLATEEGQKKLVSMLDDLHGVFAQYVAEGRGVTVDTVNSDYGKGGVLIAEKAIFAGMIDEIVGVPSRRAQEMTPVVDREIESAAHEAGKLEEAPMDMEQLKNEHPDLYAAIKGEGREEERARVSRLIKAADSDPDNPKLQELVTETIASGESYEEISDKVSVAIRDGKKLDGENAPAVSTMPDMEALSEEDKQAAKMMGMSFEEYRKYMGGNE